MVATGEVEVRRDAELIPLVSYGSSWERVGSRYRAVGTAVPFSRALVLLPRPVLVRRFPPDMVAGVQDRRLEVLEEMVWVT